MKIRFLAAGAVVVLLEPAAALSLRQDTVTLAEPALPIALARKVDPVIDRLWSDFAPGDAMDDVRFISRFWRIAGNPGYDASIDRMHARLLASGFTPAARAPARSERPSTWIEQYPNTGHGWSYSVGTLALVRASQPDEILLSRDTHQIALCINSFSTPSGGLTARLVDVGAGDSESDYAGKSIEGAVVLGDAAPEALWRFAVVARGAAGIVSAEIAPFVSPYAPGRPDTPRDRWEVLQWGSVPYDARHRAFGFKATPHAAWRLRQALAADPRTEVHVTTESGFSVKPVRTLVAEIPGRAAAEERVVVAAHVQEPGANDNASGAATLVELARALAHGIATGAIPRPERTITFLWLDEISGSQQWLRDHAEQAARVKYMFSLDMTGEDVTKTGGSFLIERWPDPGAVWDRPWDPHTAWGRGDVRAEQLAGDLINDVHLAICRRVAQRSGWIVNTNPYEGGSDHTVFGKAGVPAVLDWHFTDRYYHTNFDTPDKTSAAEMRNVGVSVGASAWLLAAAGEPEALAAADLVAQAGRARLDVEGREGAALAGSAGDPSAARLRQAEIVAAWQRWYAQAVRSAVRLVIGPPSADAARRIEALAVPFER